jgi:hypothetical protein
MLNSFLTKLIAAYSLIIGRLTNSWFSSIRKTPSIIIALGEGASISAFANELSYESAKIRRGTYLPIFGFFTVPRFAVSVPAVKLRYCH